MELLGSLLLIAFAYLIGSVPWGLLLGRVFKGVDVRQHGSGATGATNALRVLGWKFSVVVFLLDFAKGLIPVVIGRIVGLDVWVVGIVGVAAVFGHCWSPFIGFKGGKGMATSGGAAIGMFPFLLVVFAVMAGIVALTRYVSLASLAAAIVGPLIVLTAATFGDFPWPWVLATATMGVLIVGKHRSNIERLLAGTERRFGERAT
jgi:acyl phosphate:glycerol-3-phosphate acyltransferase